MNIRVRKYDAPDKKECKFGASITVEGLNVDQESPLTNREGVTFETMDVYEKTSDALEQRVSELVARTKLNRIREAGRNVSKYADPVEASDSNVITI